MSYFIPDQLVFLFQQEIFFAFIILLLWFVLNKEKPSRCRAGTPIGVFFSLTLHPASVTWILTQLRQWKIKLHFSMLIAIPPKQCNQGLMCTYNFILDISLTAIYCLKGKRGEGTSRCPLSQNKPSSFMFEGSVFAKSKQMAIIMGFTYVLS